MSDAYELEILSNEWDKALVSENWDDAFDICLNGYRLALRTKDHVHVMMFLGFLQIATERQFEKLSRKRKEPDIHTCSFCGKSADQVKLVSGAGGVAICIDCARLASES